MIKGKKVRKINKNVVDKSDKQLEKEAEYVESVSIFMVLLIVGICSLVGIGLGYALFKIAINSSVAAIFIK